MPDFRSAVAATALQDIAVTGHGLVSWVGNPNWTRSTLVSPTVGSASGTVAATILPLRRGQTVTNLVTCVATVGTNVSFAKLALLNSTGGFIAATASASASFNVGTGYKVIPLTAAYSVTADGLYNIAFLQYGAGATGAALLTGVASAPAASSLGGVRPNSLTATMLTDLAADVTFTDGANPLWFACS